MTGHKLKNSTGYRRRAEPLGLLFVHRQNDCRTGFAIARIAIGIFLLAVAALKCYQLSTEPIVGKHFYESHLFLTGVVEFELLFGAWLLWGGFQEKTWIAALIYFSLLTCISFYRAVLGNASCGCFGRLSISPWYTSGIDLAIVLVLVYWQPKPLRKFTDIIDANRYRSIFIRVIVIWLAIGVPAALAMGRNIRFAFLRSDTSIEMTGTVVLEPSDWVGKDFPLIKYIDVGENLSKGDWVVLLYHSDCSLCQKVLPEYVRLSHVLTARGEKKRVALVEVPNRRYEVVLNNDPNCLWGRLDPSVDWFVQTPCEIVIHNGIEASSRQIELGKAVTVAKMD